MCGLFGINSSKKEAIPAIIGALYNLEYRGYDSAGLAVAHDNHIELHKVVGKVFDLDKSIYSTQDKISRIGIGHCRWASHGLVQRCNAHPFQGCERRFAIAHNGVIDNYKELKAELKARGTNHYFESETDSEVVAHLLESAVGDFFERALEVVNKLQGTFALLMLDKADPSILIAAKKGSPLILGFGKGEQFAASDIPAISKHTATVHHMNDNEIAVIHKTHIDLYDFAGQKVEAQTISCTRDTQVNTMSGFESYMLKEIFEQPQAVQNLVDKCLATDEHKEKFIRLGLPIHNANYINFIGCGSAYYASMFTSAVTNEANRLATYASIASEFNVEEYDLNSLSIFFSQSGSTYDTLEVAKRLKDQGRAICSITNADQNSLQQLCQDNLYLHCGPEISVASTKAFTNMAVAGAMLATAIKNPYYTNQFNRLPGAITKALDLAPEMNALAWTMDKDKAPIFIGRGPGYSITLESALKFKEITYLNAQAFAAGELKHGPISLIEEGTPVFAIIPNGKHFTRGLTAISEVRARGGVVYAITNSDQEIDCNRVIRVPDVSEMLNPILCLIPMQLLAYYFAKRLGNNCDMPRSLAKSVTVP